MKPIVLIIDDNEKLCQSLARNFQDAGMEALCANTRAQAMEKFSDRKIVAVLLDIMVGEESGIDILVELKRVNPRVPVVMITGYATVDSAVQALKLGAADYVKKPLDFDVLHKIVSGAIRVSRLSEENSLLKRRLLDLSPKIGVRSPQMRELMEKVRKLAVTDLPVLITGENGTGKELIADALHEGSRRAMSRLIKVNCASFPESLLDNELFGHERGSYTGADSTFKGVFEQADAGTLFLDEVGDMPMTIQTKILRTMQNKEIRRIGGSRTLDVDVRFIAATNHPIEKLVDGDTFRKDLFYRMSGAVVFVPPLRERQEDIPELARIFVEEYCLTNSLPVYSIAPGLMERLLVCPWPGNVRELKNALNYACAITAGPEIGIGDMPTPFGGAGACAEAGDLNVRERAEKDLIVKMLQRSSYNKSTTSERLSMSRKTLYNKIAKYGIKASADRAD